MPVTKVGTEWRNGNLYFLDTNGNDIFYIDGTNRALVMDAAAGFTAPLEVEATDIADAAVTLAKLANLATDTFIARDTAGTGVPEAVSAASVITMLKTVVGPAAGYKLARGVHTTLDADDTVVTGLATVVAVVVSLESDPAAGCQFVTGVVGNQSGAPAAGSIQVKTWKATAAGDTALIAATDFTKLVNWIAIGT